MKTSTAFVASEAEVVPAPMGAKRRGPFRPAALVSQRERLEVAGAERTYRAIETLVVLTLAVIVCSAAQADGLLTAPLASVLPFAVGAPVLIYALSALRAFAVSRRDPLSQALARPCIALIVTAAAVALTVLALPEQTAATTAVASWFALAAITVVMVHAIWWKRIRRLDRQGKLTPNIVIVGATANAERLVAQALATGDVAVLGIFDDRIGRVPDQICGVPVLGDTDALLGHRIMPYVDRVVITVPARAQGRVRQLIERLRVLPNEVSLFLEADGEVEPAAALSRIANSPLARVSGHRVDEARLYAKRVQDLVIGVLALIVATPVMLGVAVAVRLDSPGPVVFRQRRHGFNNEQIVVWKFRSMRHEAADATASRQITLNDDRVTKVGRFIRKTSLDELPQLFNVIAGDMSLVGPRPHAIGMKTGDQESARLVAEYAHRHRVKPGVTGWAAIHGSRGPVDTPEEVRRRVGLDVDYIERQSLWLDLYILLMTVPCLVGDRDAVR